MTKLYMETNGLFGPKDLIYLEFNGTINKKTASLDKPTRKKLEALIEKQEYKCAITGLLLTPDTASCDHIVAIKKGGQNAMSNIQVVHKDVNRIKGTLSMEELQHWCRLILGIPSQEAE